MKKEGVKVEYILDGKQMKQIDDYTINQVGIPAMVLMENAARSVSNKMLEKISLKDSILCICGTGNNGGDGVAVARILKQKGYLVDLYIIGDEHRGSEQFKQQIQIARNLGVNVINNAKISEYNVIVDAIFGLGLNKEIGGAFEAAIREVNQSENIVYSIDIPSGIHTDTGEVMNVAIKADYTITFGYQKLGLILYPGADYVGELTIADIGFSEQILDKIGTKICTYNKEDLERIPGRKNRSNKGTYGRVLIIAGSKNMSGACYLSAKAAYRSGAGLIKILSVEENRSIIQNLLPEAILTTYQPVNLKNKLEIDQIVREIEWATVIVFGPGVGISAGTDMLLDLVLSRAKVPVILDADGLNLLANKTEYVSEDDTGNREIELPSNIIITPHLKEMSRLLNCSTEEVSKNIMMIAKTVTQNKQFVLALKDARTVVSNSEMYYINTSGNHGMATGGSGDVLTGVIAALVAAGMSTYEATCLGVYVHGLAGDVAKEEKGAYSMMASDIIESLPQVLK